MSWAQCKIHGRRHNVASINYARTKISLCFARCFRWDHILRKCSVAHFANKLIAKPTYSRDHLMHASFWNFMFQRYGFRLGLTTYPSSHCPSACGSRMRRICLWGWAFGTNLCRPIPEGASYYVTKPIITIKKRTSLHTIATCVAFCLESHPTFCQIVAMDQRGERLK